MKVLVVFSFLILAACNIRAQLTKMEAVAIVTGCKEEAGASDADYEAMAKYQPAETKEGKCMRACIQKKFGVMSDDGKMLKEGALELSNSYVKDDKKKELVVEIIEVCEGLKVSDDHCEAAQEYESCMKNEFEFRGISA